MRKQFRIRLPDNPKPFELGIPFGKMYVLGSFTVGVAAPPHCYRADSQCVCQFRHLRKTGRVVKAYFFGVAVAGTSVRNGEYLNYYQAHYGITPQSMARVA